MGWLFLLEFCPTIRARETARVYLVEIGRGRKFAFLTIIPEFLLRWKNRPETGKIDFSPVPIFFGSRSCRCRRCRCRHRRRRRPKKRERNYFSRFLVNKQKIGFLLFRSKFGQQKNMLGRGSQERGTSLSFSLSLSLSLSGIHTHILALSLSLSFGSKHSLLRLL